LVAGRSSLRNALRFLSVLINNYSQIDLSVEIDRAVVPQQGHSHIGNEEITKEIADKRSNKKNLMDVVVESQYYK
jgi:hypothetical protein